MLKRTNVDLVDVFSANRKSGENNHLAINDDEYLTSGSPRLRPDLGGEKLIWSSEDEVQQAAKQKPSRQRHRSSVSGKNQHQNKKQNNNRTVNEQANTKRYKSSTKSNKPHKLSGFDQRDNEETDYDDENDTAVGCELPDYLQVRRADLNLAAQSDQATGFRLPPRHSFTTTALHDDGTKLKPYFQNSTPRAPFEDIELYSNIQATSPHIKGTAPFKLGILPASLAQWLRDYQVEGAHFLLDRFVFQQGGILGDDMGLGKTIQVIAFLTAAFGKSANGRDINLRRIYRASYPSGWYPRVLIICPGSLMDNWQDELNTWGYWDLVRYHGSTEDKSDALAAAQNGSAEIMLTTYGMYRRDHGSINLVNWDCVIADECHSIKDPKAEITKAMNQVNALCRFGLTGTAIQNSYDELWTLLNWANPGAVSSLANWKKYISAPLRNGQSHDATTFQHGTARRTAEKLKTDLLPRFFLRRWKSLIADQLPKKRDRIVFCPLTAYQASAYQTFIQSDMVQAVLTASDPCDCGSGGKRGWCCYAKLSDGKSWHAYTFPSIMALLNISNHLALLIPSGMEDHEKFEKARRILRLALPDKWQDLMRQKDSISHLNNQQFCGKWSVLLKSLKWWYDHGDKVLIFSHSIKLLQGLKLLFASTSYNYSYLDGSMKYEERTEAVNAFNNDKHHFVFLISIRAGGVGLNITSANKVVIFDPNWNPAHDLQAQDRAYRIGQTRNVDVFRLVSVGTIEETVYARQVYKQQQADIAYKASLERRYFKGVQNDKGKKGELFGLKNLLSYQPDHIVLQSIVNNTNVAESKAGILVTNVDFNSQVTSHEYVEETRSSTDIPAAEDEQDAAVQLLSDMVNSQLHGQKSKRIPPIKSGGANGIEHILAQAGVQYFHDNAEVIGTSKIESKLSRRAMERTTDLAADDEIIFAVDDKDKDDGSDDFDINDELLNRRSFASRFRPFEDVRVRQFCSMAQSSGLTVEQFAIEVESWTQKERSCYLENFYESRNRFLQNQHFA